jgi:hypothetical protein
MITFYETRSFIAALHQSTNGPHTIMMTQLNPTHALFSQTYCNTLFHLHLGQLNILPLQIVILKLCFNFLFPSYFLHISPILLFLLLIKMNWRTQDLNF